MTASIEPCPGDAGGGFPTALPRAKRNCTYCVFSQLLPGDEPGKRICVNHIESPGQLRPVEGGETCRNFRAKRQPTVRTEPPTPPNDEIRYVALTQGKFALVDAADYEWLNQYKWYVSKGHADKCYAMCHAGRRRPIRMHRLLMKPPAGLVVDHIDGNGLNNRRSNLRICTQAQNLRNRPGRSATSRFKGVSFDKRRNLWAACISQKDRTIHIGYFEDEIEAAIAYDLRAIVLAGEFAYLNFPHIINATSQARRPRARRTATRDRVRVLDNSIRERLGRLVRCPVGTLWD